MTYIPDCRDDEYYNFDALKGQDQEFVRGFDWCTEMAVDTFMDNFVDTEGDSYIAHILNQELPEYMQGEYTVENTFTLDNAIDKTEIRQVKTYADLIRSKILDWIESERDELIVSIIDGYGEDEEE